MWYENAPSLYEWLLLGLFMWNYIDIKRILTVLKLQNKGE